MKVRRNERAVAIIGGTVGVPLRFFPVLAFLEVAGAAGILVALWLKPLGVLAAACLVAYFAGAALGHLRVGDTKHLTMPLPPLVLSVIVLVLRLRRAWGEAAPRNAARHPPGPGARVLTIQPTHHMEVHMKAFAITARDASPAVQELPQPQPGPGEVLVAVEAASVNGFDLSVAAGYVWDMLPHEFPVVLGRDFVGTVSAVGDGVEQVTVGDRVAGVIPGVALGTGALGEYVAVPATAVTTVPAGVDVHQAAAVGLAGVAAHDAVEALDPRPGEVVLVSGATGG